MSVFDLGPTTISGDAAKSWNAVSLSDFKNVNDGELVEADVVTGKVIWKDKTGEKKEKTLGDHAIRLIRR